MLRINNDRRRHQYARYEKYCIAAERIGIVIPEKHAFDPDAAIAWLSKHNDAKIWPAVVAEARRLFPETFQSAGQ